MLQLGDEVHVDPRTSAILQEQNINQNELGVIEKIEGQTASVSFVTRDLQVKIIDFPSDGTGLVLANQMRKELKF